LDAVTDLRHLPGPFDIIGDVHGCFGELVRLLERLGYRISGKGRGSGAITATPPPGRQAVFVGDLVDRGPDSPGVLRLVMAMCAAGNALCIPGNHDAKFLRWLEGRNVALTHGLDITTRQFAHEPDGFRDQIRGFLTTLPIYLWLDAGALAVAHAGLKPSMLGRSGQAIRSFCLYGDTDGKLDEHGLAIRYHWALGHPGTPTIVYGHTPVDRPEWVNNTLCIDTGCAFGGAMTALRWPEREIVSVSAEQAWAKRLRPFGHPPPRPG
jgi:protein phosphatase